MTTPPTGPLHVVETDSARIRLVLSIAADEKPGDHFLSHYIFAKKVLRGSCAEAIALAKGFAHRRLTREDCEGLLADWREEGWA